MKGKKYLLGLTVLSSVLVLGACGGSKDKKADKEAADFSIKDRYTVDPEKPAWELDKKEDLTELTWYVNADWWNDTWGEDTVTKQLQKDLNVKIKFIKGDDTKMNTMFAGDDVADLVTVFDSNSQVAKKANTWAYSLNELSEKYDPYWNKVAAQDTMNWFQLKDGKTYGYPDYSNTAKDYDDGLIPSNTNFLIRKDVYEKLGSPKLGTPEEFRDVMKKIKTEFPDLLPFGFNAFGEGTGSLGDALQDFLGVPLTKDGKWNDRNLDEEYLKWLSTLRDVHSDGNISDDSFADDGTAFEEKVKSGQYATIFASGTAQMSGFLQSWYQENNDAQYIGIDGPQSFSGRKPTLNQSGITGWMLNFISKSCKDPAKAMQIFTYLQSEKGQILTSFGIEGETFQKDADGKIELLPEVLEVKNSDPDRYKKEYRLSEFIFFGHDKYQTLASDKTKTPALIQPREWGEGKLYPHFIVENINPDTGTPEARNLTAIDKNWQTTLASLIRSGSQKEFDSIINEYKDFQKQNGWDDIVKIRTEKMLANAKKLNIEIK